VSKTAWHPHQMLPHATTPLSPLPEERLAFSHCQIALPHCNCNAEGRELLAAPRCALVAYSLLTLTVLDKETVTGQQESHRALFNSPTEAQQQLQQFASWYCCCC
jgi:hypothetical protein